MHSIYICSTYYHALIACMKALRQAEMIDIAVTEYIAGAEILFDSLKKSGIFSDVWFFKTPEIIEPKNKIDKFINLHGKYFRKIKEQFNFDFSKFDEVFIFHDDTWIAHYLKDSRIYYNLIEDGLDSYKTINNSIFSFIADNSFKTKIKRIINYGYKYLDKCPFVKSIEVNDKSGVSLGRLIVVPRKDMFEELSDADKLVLAGIFQVEDCIACPITSGTIFFTEPFADDGMTTYEKQYDIVKELTKGYDNVYIKPHPRDNCDYECLNCIFLKKNIPFEILAITGSVRFDRAVMSKYCSIRGFAEVFHFADELVLFDPEVLSK